MLARMWSKCSFNAGGNAKRYSYFGKQWQFFTKLSIVLPYDLVITLLVIYQNEVKTYVQTKTCIQMLIYNHQTPEASLTRVAQLVCLLQSKKSQVLCPQGHMPRFQVWSPVGVPRLVVPDWGTYKRQVMDVSLTRWCFSPPLSPSLTLSLKINK